MDSRGLKLRFQFLTAGLSKCDLSLLGGLALEWELTNGQFAALKGAGVDRRPGVNLPLHPLLSAWVASGLAYRSDNSQRPRRRALFEPVYGVNPEYRQLILRQLSESGELDEVALDTHRAMEGRTMAPLFVALQQGDLSAFDRFVNALRTQDSSLGGNTFVEALRESVCQPFDASWFERVWDKRAVEVAARVLRDSAWSLRPVDGLYEWARATALVEGTLATGHGPLLALSLAEQALTRGRAEDAEPYIDVVPELYRGWYRAAARFVAGDAQEAHEWLRKQVSVELALEKRAASDNAMRPELDAAHAIGALLLIGRDESDGVGLVKRLASARYLDERSQRVARALKTLLRYHAHVDQETARIDIHQLDTEGCAWELVILALVVQMYQQGEWSRANWARVLAERGLLWLDAGFAWASRQTLFLGQVLSEEHFTQRYDELMGAAGEPLSVRPGEVLLADLLTPKPEWAKQLDALDELVLVEEVEEFGVASASRVVWYVDMVRGELNKPALQELTPGGGWSSGRRVTAAELLDVVEQLPEEDAAVVHRSIPTADGERAWPPEALELLVGHVRVFNAAKKRQAVQVVLGQARVETREERGQVELFVEPKDLSTGLNVHSDGESRITLYRVTPQSARLIQQIDQGIRVPANETARLRAVLGKISQVMDVRSSHLGDVEQVVPDSRVVLRISPVGGAWVVQAGVKPFSERGSFYVTAFGRRELSILHRGRRLRCDRDFDAEKAALTQVLLICPTLARARADAAEEDDTWQQEQRWSFGEEGLLTLLAELRDAQADVRLEWPESTALRLRATGPGRGGINVKLRRNKGWYLATGGIKIDDLEEWSLDQLMAMPATGTGRFVRLPNGDYIEVEQRVRRVMDALRAAGEPRAGKSEELSIHESAISTLETLAASSEVQIEDSLSQWLETVARVRGMDWPVPVELQGTLRGYQHEGFRWLSCLSELGLGACLADDMGLGKTVQLLALLLRRQAQGPILVVAPTSVCSNWINEAKRFAPTLRSIEYVGNNRAGMLKSVGPGTLMICSYGLLQQDVESLSAVKWGTAVLDEAQFIKNPESLRAKAAYRLDAAFRVISTGTPVENHLGDLWSIFHFLNPDLFGTWKGFQRRFVRSIERENDQRAKQELRDLVKPYVLRRTKSQVLDDLPPLTAVKHEVRLSEVESQQYAILRKQIWEKLHNTSVKRYNKLEILAEITRLRRFCCHPRLVFPEAELESSKIDAFIELVEELRENGHQALVFSQFVDFLSLVRGQLDDRAIPYLYLDGSTSRAARAERVAEFQRGECPLFLISLKAGGFGLNLTAADYVIHLDPWWNPAVEAQATDRAHRIGQQRPVTVYRLVTKDTIEERILSLHEEKKAIAAAVLDSDDATSVIPTEQLLDLIAAQ